MDPNATLAQLRDAIKSWNETNDEAFRVIDEMRENDRWNKADEYLGYHEQHALEVVGHLAALVEALDDWIVAGGALPVDWTRYEGE